MCESEACGYDPTSGEFTKAPRDISMAVAIAYHTDLDVSVEAKPFRRVRFTHPDLGVIEDVKRILNWTGPIFQHAGDLLDDPAYGFDIVKKDADALITAETSP